MTQQGNQPIYDNLYAIANANLRKETESLKAQLADSIAQTESYYTDLNEQKKKERMLTDEILVLRTQIDKATLQSVAHEKEMEELSEKFTALQQVYQTSQKALESINILLQRVNGLK